MGRVSTDRKFSISSHAPSPELRSATGLSVQRLSRTCLSAITALKQFVYFHAGPVVGTASYDPIGIIDVLRRYAAHTLEVLNIEAHHNSISTGDDDLDHDGDHVGSMHMFCSLKTIRLEDHLFQIQYSDQMSSSAVPGDVDYDESQAEDPSEPG